MKQARHRSQALQLLRRSVLVAAQVGCRCPKMAYKTEAAALKEIRDYLGGTLRAYKCPGHPVWHTTAVPLARAHHVPLGGELRRKIAALLLDERQATVDAVAGVLGDPTRTRQHAASILRDFARHGLVTLLPDQVLTAVQADQRRLLRVVIAGWDGLVAPHRVGALPWRDEDEDQ